MTNDGHIDGYINLLASLLSPNESLAPKREKSIEEELIKQFKGLRECDRAGYRPLFIPEIIDLRLNLDKRSPLWMEFFTTPSIKATGKTRGGNEVIVYAHIPSYFSDPSRIDSIIKKGLINGAGITSQREFNKLVDLEDGKNIFVLDYKKFKNYAKGDIPLVSLLPRSSNSPIMGGEERMMQYFITSTEFWGHPYLLYQYFNDSFDKPLVRQLYIHRMGHGFGDTELSNNGNFLGLPKSYGVEK